MVNITIAPGGGVIANGVVTYLPKCSTLKFEDVNLQNAAAFDITDSSYLEVCFLPQPACRRLVLAGPGLPTP